MTELRLKSKNASCTLLPSRGALISSLQLLGLKNSKQELLWLPHAFDPTSSAWPGGGLPFLFPFAGRVWNHGTLHQYGLGTHSFPMPLHGFSWATSWTVDHASNQDATLSLHTNETSLGIYPFDFKIVLHIKLEDQSFHASVKITHIQPKLRDCILMPVASGWHPYFSLNQQMAKVTVPAQTIFPVTAQGGAGKPLNAKDSLGASPWTFPHAELKSLILSDLATQESTLKIAQNPEIIISSGPAETMNHVVTWSNQVQEFICIEPWMSLPDAVATPSGCKWLAAGESFSIWLRVQTKL